MSWTMSSNGYWTISAVSFAPYIPLVSPTVTTQTSSNILNWTFTGNGNITDTGSSAVTVRGICYSTTSNPPTTAVAVAPWPPPYATLVHVVELPKLPPAVQVVPFAL